MVLRRRELTTVREREPVDRLNAFGDDVAYVPVFELLRRLVQNAHAHLPNPPPPVAEAVLAGEMTTDATPTYAEAASNRSPAVAGRGERVYLFSLLGRERVAVALPHGPHPAQLVERLRALA